MASVNIIQYFMRYYNIGFAEKVSNSSSVYQDNQTISEKNNHAAYIGNDGISEDFTRLMVTKHETQPYWLVDLGRNCTVWAVNFFNNNHSTCESFNSET